MDANGVASGVDAECKSQGKFGTGWEANDGRILGGWPANSITDSCTIEAFTFKGCAVNETRKLIEYQRKSSKYIRYTRITIIIIQERKRRLMKILTSAS